MDGGGLWWVVTWFSLTRYYNKEAVSRTLCNLCASASRVTASGAGTALYKFAI